MSPTRRQRGEGSDVQPPPRPQTLSRRDAYYAEALRDATEVTPLQGRDGVAYCWLLPPSRNTWPTWHINRPAPTPGCGCAACHRPRCCDAWAEPVDSIVTGETLAWICPTCLEEVRP